MSKVEEECKHGLTFGCTYCSGKEASAGSQTPGAGGEPEPLDTPESLEKYRARYPGDREPTFEAYVEVFFRLSGARDFPGGWTNFSRCANAEPALVRDESALVSGAEELMRVAGYESDDSGRPKKGRRWHRTANR
jgi:hypothetical protein